MYKPIKTINSRMYANEIVIMKSISKEKNLITS